MNQNICQIQDHKSRGIISICFSTNCKGQRVCCQMCQNQLHNDHPDQLIDIQYLLQYIRTESQKPNALSPEVSQRLQELQNVLNHLEDLSKLIRKEIKKLSEMNEYKVCEQLGNQFNILNENFLGMRNQDWNQLAEDMLLNLYVNHCEILLKNKNDSISQNMVIIQDKLKELQKQINQILNEKQYFQNSHGPQLMQGHTNVVCGIDINQQRKLLVSGSADKTVKLWNLENNALINTYQYSGEVYDVCLSNFGNFLAFGGGGDYSIKLVDISNLQQNEIISQLCGHKLDIWRLKFSNNSKYLISGSSDCTVRIWDINTKEKFQFNTDSTVHGISISSDDAIIASLSDDGKIRIWSFIEKKLLCIQPAHQRGSEIQLSNDQNTLISSGYDGVIKVWNFKDLKNHGKIVLIKELKVSNNCIWTMLFSTCSKFIISISYKDRETKVIDLQTGDVVKVFKLYTTLINYNTVDIAMSKDMNILAYSEDRNIAVWRTSQ